MEYLIHYIYKKRIIEVKKFSTLNDRSHFCIDMFPKIRQICRQLLQGLHQLQLRVETFQGEQRGLLPACRVRQSGRHSVQVGVRFGFDPVSSIKV